MKTGSNYGRFCAEYDEAVKPMTTISKVRYYCEESFTLKGIASARLSKDWWQEYSSKKQ